MVNFYYHAFSLTGLKIKIEIILLVTFIIKEICCAGKKYFYDFKFAFWLHQLPLEPRVSCGRA